MNMEFLDLIKKRYSVRAYYPDPVEDEKLQKVLEAARLAPTAANRQPFQIIVIHTKGRRKELNNIYPAVWFVQAPLLICACSIHDQAWTRRDGKNYGEVDTAIVMDHIILTAASLGLGTCWIGAFNAEAARKVLGLPDNVEPLAFTPLGYPAVGPEIKDRKKLSELVRYERW
jgi:nitroreductase